MLIGYTENMTDQQVSELADWADYHAKDIPNTRWKRGYALIREGADLLLRRRAGILNDPPVEEGGVCSEPTCERKELGPGALGFQHGVTVIGPKEVLAKFVERRNPNRTGMAAYKRKRASDYKQTKVELKPKYLEHAGRMQGEV